MSKRWDLTNQKDLKKVQGRIKTSYLKLTKDPGGVSDCVQEVITRLLEGRHKHATIDQAVIDYLRECRNLKGFRRNLKREAPPKSNSYEQNSFDEFIGADPRESLGSGIFADQLIGMSKHWERAVMSLFFVEGYGQAEIGNFFGVSGSRVHQWLKRIQKRVQQRIKAAESRARACQMETVLSQETKGNWWGMEQVSFERMATCESFGMASLNEASF